MDAMETQRAVRVCIETMRYSVEPYCFGFDSPMLHHEESP